jgi:hypothetical protein
MMTEPNWDSPAPAEAGRAVILAAERASYGEVHACNQHLTDSGVDPAWLAVTAIRVLAMAFAGEDSAAKFDKCRHELAGIAEWEQAHPGQLAQAVEVVWAAQYWQAQMLEELHRVTKDGLSTPIEQACIATQIYGQLVGSDELGCATFAALKACYGIGDGAA